MGYLNNTPDVSSANLEYSLDALVGVKPSRHKAYMEKMKAAYLKTSVACMYFNKFFLGRINLKKWRKLSSKAFDAFIRQNGWKFQ